ncbi:MAG: hypothetical protein JO214_15985 [Frankiaceae bacterium]|nr:hypothetical protein [Frankiaceae bacterium]
MSTLRLLNNGEWNKSPTLTAARQILIRGLGAHCQKASLGQLAVFVNGTNYDPGQLATDGTPIIRISNISDPKSTVRPGDLLVSWSASFKSTIWQGPTGVLNQHIFKVTEHPPNGRAYIRHAIEAVFDEMQRKVVGIGMMHLRRSDFIGHEVPVPDPETQQLVGRFLDWVETDHSGPEPQLPPELFAQQQIVSRVRKVMARVEQARSLRKAAIAEVDTLLPALVEQLLRRWAPSRAPLRLFLQEPLLNGLSLPSFTLGSGATFAKVGSVNTGQFDPTETKLANVVLGAHSPYWLKCGDLLISRGNTPDLVGRAAVYVGVPEPCAMPDLLIRARMDPDAMNPHFLALFFRTREARMYIESVAAGTNPSMKKISQPKLLGMPVPSVSLDVQKRILSHVDLMNLRIQQLLAVQSETGVWLDRLLPTVLDRAMAEAP